MERLPFPIHGTRTSGDGSPAVCMGDAARLLYLTNLIADTAKIPVFGLRSSGPNGTSVAAQVAGPLAFKKVHTDETLTEEQSSVTPFVFARLVWLPEGFVLTPRSDGAPDGFGMPPTKNGLGTPGGPLREVIVNRFKDNQYPDALYRYAGVKDNDKAIIFSGSLFFTDWELTDKEFGLGVVVDYGGGGGKLIPQFSKRWVTKFREPDGGKWFCHRPRYAPKESPAEAAIRQETNLVRERVGAKPLGKPLRGSVGELSQNVLYQIRYSGEVEHDSAAFREGHRTFGARARDRAGLFAAAGENLHADSGATPDKGFALSATSAWEDSPIHFENMVFDWGQGGNNYGWVDSAVGALGRFTNSGAAAAQIFYSAFEWVAHGVGTHEDKPPVTVADGLGESDMFLPMYPQHATDDYAARFTYQPDVVYRGRTINITAGPVLWDHLRVLSGCVVTLPDGEATKLRVAVLLRPNPHGSAACVVMYEGDAHDFLETKREVSRYWLPFEDGSFISRTQWSKSGNKAVFCYTEVEDAPRTVINSDNWTASPMAESARPVIGQKIHFVEFRDEGFHHILENSLTITPASFGLKSIGGNMFPYHSEECEGECELLAAYDGEDVVYATVVYEGATEYVGAASHTGGYKYEKSIKGSLVFPNGTELPYVDIHTETHTIGGQPKTCLVGFVRHLMPAFDIMDPEGVAYVQYDLPTPDNQWLTMKVTVCGEVVKFCQDPLDRGEGMYATPFEMDVPTLGAHRGMSVHSGAGVDFFTSMRGWFFTRQPAVPYKAVLVGYSHTTAPYPLPRGPELTEYWQEDEYVLLGPTILTDGIFEHHGHESGWFEGYGYRRVEKFRQCRYKGERLYAGRIEATLGSVAPEYDVGTNSFKKHGAFREKQNQYYWFCTFNLRAAVAMSDLGDNILPIGVL